MNNPKFKVGDEVVHTSNTFYRIHSIESDHYILYSHQLHRILDNVKIKFSDTEIRKLTKLELALK